MRRILSVAVLASMLSMLMLMPGLSGRAEDKPEEDYRPKISPASPEAKNAIKRIRVPENTRLELFAAEPLLANPVAFCTDENGDFYVVETFRLHAGVTDIRRHMDWLDDDLACRTVADRVAMYRKYLKKEFGTYGIEHDRVRKVIDSDGDGVADKSTVFAEGFNSTAVGIGAGLLARGGDVWYTCIPDLWLLTDTDGDGKADERKVLSTGYGVHVGFLGHDLHGLRIGPDGRIYFSIGDRGIHVEAAGRVLDLPDTGVVLRCWPDGSELEVFASGLRNPQELAFDEFGNLFTGDNNSDSGDKARWVYLVEGGDSGWRIGYQFMSWPTARGPWNLEKLWHLPWVGQAAYHLPPLEHIGDGPSGLTYHPGTSQLPEKYRNHFFLCDFRGSSGNSGIRAFKVKPKGASFEVVDQHQMVWSLLVTDADFAPDGALYMTDWVEGWDKPGKGRIYRLTDSTRPTDAAATETKKLIAEGMGRRKPDELGKLLAHADMRIRQEAQFALAARGPEGEAVLAAAAKANPERLARLHGLWGLGQIARTRSGAVGVAVPLLADADPEVRAQAAKVLGDARAGDAFDGLVKLLKDGEPRVRFFATQALGKLGRKEAVGPVLAMLRENADQDAYLRHAGVMALAGAADLDSLLAHAKDDSPSARMGVVLTLRRWGKPEIARFLEDADLRVAVEAARAIYDSPIPEAMPALAGVLSDAPGSEVLLRRILRHNYREDPAEKAAVEPYLQRAVNANFRLGGAANAGAVAAFAARSDVPELLRLDALKALAEWEKPSGRDRVVGLWRPVEAGSRSFAAEAVRPVLAGILTGPDAVRREGVQLVGKLGIKEVGPLLFGLVSNDTVPGGERADALEALAAVKDSRTAEAITRSLEAKDELLRIAARHLLAARDPKAALPSLSAALEKGTQAEKQAAFATLGSLRSFESRQILDAWLDLLLKGGVPSELRLDLIEAASERGGSLKAKVDRYEATRPKDDPMAAFADALAGGNADRGRRIFFEKTAVSCLRCHKVRGEGGEVGPELFGLAAKQPRTYLLEAIVLPGKQIAKGYETLVLTLSSGKTVTGILKGENHREVQLITPEGQLLTIARDKIDERATGQSAMPADLIKNLSRSEVRDLVEFLATLK